MQDTDSFNGNKNRITLYDKVLCANLVLVSVYCTSAACKCFSLCVMNCVELLVMYSESWQFLPKYLHKEQG